MSSASYTNRNEGAVHHEGEVPQHFQGSREAAVWFWVAIKEKGKKSTEKGEHGLFCTGSIPAVWSFWSIPFKKRSFLMTLIFLPSTRNTKAYLNITKKVIQSFLTFKNVCFGPSFVPKPWTVFILYKLFCQIPEECIVQKTIFSTTVR